MAFIFMEYNDGMACVYITTPGVVKTILSHCGLHVTPLVLSW